MTETSNGTHGSVAPTASEADIAQMPFGPAANMAEYDGPESPLIPGEDLYVDGGHPFEDRP